MEPLTFAERAAWVGLFVDLFSISEDVAGTLADGGEFFARRWLDHMTRLRGEHARA